MDQFLELNTILQHPVIVVELMVKNKVAPGIALQFVSNIKILAGDGKVLKRVGAYFQGLFPICS